MLFRSAGSTGTFELRVRLHDGTLVDQDLDVKALHMVPGTLSNVHIGPTDPTTGALSDLRISFGVRNPLPINSSIVVTLPFEDLTIDGQATSGQLVHAGIGDGTVGISVERTIVEVKMGGQVVNKTEEVLTLQRIGATSAVAPCVKPVCSSDNIVPSDAHPTRFASSWRRPPSYATYAFASVAVRGSAARRCRTGCSMTSERPRACARMPFSRVRRMCWAICAQMGPLPTSSWDPWTGAREAG